MVRKATAAGQGALFEEDYLLRALGSIGSNAEVALTELVANARDAGASKASVRIPAKRDDLLIIEDNGTGMTPAQFKTRWMTLGYNRSKQQGPWVEYPPGSPARRVRAFGRNGIGRHGLLCFSDHYVVETTRDGTCSTFDISTTAGTNPFEIRKHKTRKAEGHGTVLKAVVVRNLPSSARIREVLGSRFLHDPQFGVDVNGRSVPLTKLSGFVAEDIFQVGGDDAHMYVFDTHSTSRRVNYQGIAFWVAGKLVGTPSWIVGDRAILDGRTRAGRRYNVVVRCPDDFADLIDSDWTSFKRHDKVVSLFDSAARHIEQKMAYFLKGSAADTRRDALSKARERIQSLPRAARREVVEFTREVTEVNPSISTETLSTAVDALINLENTRYGASLLEKLSRLPEHDVEALDRLLNDWSIRDAMTVLDEIDGRLKLIATIERFENDESADELRTLHPLVTRARWVFGAEYDSPEFASNLSLRNAVEKIFRVRAGETSFVNPKQRPDLIVLPDASLSVTATETIDSPDGLAKLSTILIIELKRGKSSIGRPEMNQADGYVQDLLQSGFLDGTPYINAFVVGHSIAEKTETRKTVGDPEKAKVIATTFSQLTRTASKRLFSLKQRLADRYDGMESDQLLDEVLAMPTQGSLPLSRR